MTLDEMRAELDHWTFMPGWRFELVEEQLDVAHPCRVIHDQHAVLRIRSLMPNTYPPHELIDTAATYPVPVEAIERGHITFANYLREMVHDRLVHEGDEWLKRDGVAVFDPHREER